MSNQFLDKSGLKQFWIRIAARLAGKVDKVTGKDLSSNDYTNEDKSKVQTMKAAAAKNVDSFIVSASTSENLPTSKAVASFVENKGYKTTDNNTTYTIIQNESNGRMLTLRGSDGTSKTVTIPDSVPIVDLSTLGIENVKNIDQSKAIKTIRRDGTTFIYTCLDGTTGTFTQQDNNTWIAMVGATSDSNGRAGYVPAPPSSGYNTKYLRADGTWTAPPNSDTKYTLTQDTSDRHKFIFAGTDGTNVSITIPDNNTTYTISQDETNPRRLILTGSDGSSKALTIPDSDTQPITYTLTQDVSDGHKLTFAGSDGSTKTITIPDNDTNYTLESLGLSNVQNLDQSKAIKSISRSGTTFTYTCLDGTTGTFTQQDTDTTYESKTAAQNGSELSLVTTGEKYAWNQKTSSSGTITKVQVNGTEIASAGTANIPAASTSAYGATKLSSATNSSSEDLAATPKAVKAAYDLAASKTNNTGTVTNISTGVGLVGGDITDSGTIKANLRSDTRLMYPSIAAPEQTLGRIYPVAIDSDGKLCVDVPWTDDNNKYYAGTGLSLSGSTFSNTGVTGIKGNAENIYRSGEVNLTPANIGAMPATPANIELSSSTPYIDFHFGNSSNDYTSRIIEYESGKLQMISDLSVSGQLSAQEATSTVAGLMSASDKSKLDSIPASGNYVTGVKGGAESAYRTGNVNITAANIGLLSYTFDYETVEYETDSAESAYVDNIGNASRTGYTIVGCVIKNIGSRPKYGPSLYLDSSDNLMVEYTHKASNSATSYSFRVTVLYMKV